MTWLDFVFFFYIFVGFYISFLFLTIFFTARKELFVYPKGKPEPVSIVMPCYNESETIGEAIESLLNLDYPREMIEIIVVDDCSSDNSAEIVRKYAAKHGNVQLIVNKRNSGGAAEPTNIGIKAARYKYIAVADADSAPARDALLKMIGFLQEDEKTGGVTCSVLSKKPVTFMQRLQQIEYFIIGFQRKLLDSVDAVYVTPGPFALYSKKVLMEIGLFDTHNMTQDIEIVWRMRSYGYRPRMCLATQVYTTTPTKLKDWWKQRVRWNIGGTQCIIKYRDSAFSKGMLGSFIIPFFSISLFIGLFGLLLLAYLLSRKLFLYYLSTKYSIDASVAVLQLQDLSFSPSVLNFFGFALFFLGISFTFLVLRMMDAHKFENNNVFNVFFYSIVYLSVYPTIMIAGLYKLVTGKYSW